MWKLELLKLPKLEKHVNMTQEIQMDHHSCEKDGMTCPLYHRGVCF
jgi:hypothetical protein